MVWRTWYGTVTAATNLHLTSGHCACSSIADADLYRISDLYFKPNDEGSGLGLDSALSIIENHEGGLPSILPLGKAWFSLFFSMLPLIRRSLGKISMVRWFNPLGEVEHC